MTAEDAWEILATVYLPQHVRAWWVKPNVRLGMKSPSKLWKTDRRAEVITEIRRLTDAAL